MKETNFENVDKEKMGVSIFFHTKKILTALIRVPSSSQKREDDHRLELNSNQQRLRNKRYDGKQNDCDFLYKFNRAGVSSETNSSLAWS